MGRRTLFGALLYLLMLTKVRAIESHLESRALSVNDLPTCGLTCLFHTVPPTGCAFSDTECQCNNNELKRTLPACLLANCTMGESLDTAKVQADVCGLSKESKSREVYIYTITAFSIAVFFVTLRIIGKVAAKRLAMDDWIIITSMCVMVVPLVCILKIAGNGFGEHLWNLQQGQLLYSLRLLYISSLAYTLGLGLIKVSLCILYHEIFPVQSIRIVSYVILTWIVMSTLVIFLLTTFSCIPVQAWWNRDLHGKCLDITALAYANSASAIAQDIVLLAFPLFCIRRLNMMRYRKFVVGFMFSIGTFGCITTIIRLRTLLSFKATIDPTWDYVPVTIWTVLELACGFVCVSVPAVRILIVMTIPRSLLTPITSKSRSRSAPTPKLDSNTAKKSNHKRPSWMHISTNNYYGATPNESGSRASRSWPGPPPQSHSRSRSHQRLGSMLQNKDVDMSHVQACISPVPLEQTSGGMDQARGLQPVPASRQTHICYSCGLEDEEISALPRIGCLPDESFSKDEMKRTSSNEIRRW